MRFSFESELLLLLLSRAFHLFLLRCYGLIHVAVVFFWEAPAVVSS